MPIFSLPSPYGIGTLGKAAYDFIDFLAEAGQKYWQMLPAGPTSYGDSPYQSYSSFAGNPYYVDLDLLAEDGLLTRAELAAPEWGGDPSRVDYGKLYENRLAVLKKAAERGIPRDRAALDAFREEKRSWLPDYALFMALKKHFSMQAWSQWPEEDIRLHRPEACARWRERLREDVELYEYIQYLFYSQWKKLKAYAEAAEVEIIGDVPIYVAMDSADVWAEPQWFQLDSRNVPTEVAGVPPDYFNEDGQLWGNPLYRWDAMERDGFGWWIRRVEGAFLLFDVLRIDHFRGLESFYAVPFGEKTARKGRWIKGPGMKFVGVLSSWFYHNAFIAEDLGYMTQEVRQLLADSGFPGMKVLEFAFDSREPSDYLPHTYPRNCVCYTGTHDNDTLAGWPENADPADLAFAKEYLGLNEEEGFVPGIIRGGMGSVADLFVCQMQDWLELGTESRINVPGNPTGNWTWRMAPGLLTEELAERIRKMSVRYGRARPKAPPKEAEPEEEEPGEEPKKEKETK